ncbi:MAG: 50S ribosomal protein L17 [Melioribacteraceae bacterium]|nr:50S ribosomal protein L17 [Melioribacteraceae bacterium]
MRHRVKGRKLSRTASHRRATLNALATALFTHKKIKTTVAKAKEARSFAEGLITKAKTDSVANRRYVARFINDKDVVKELFNEIVPAIGERPGGYTRVVKLGRRLGDAAEMALLELVDFAEGVEKTKKVVKEKTVEEKAEIVSEKTEVVTEDKIEDATIVEETTEAESEDKKDDK